MLLTIGLPRQLCHPEQGLSCHHLLNMCWLPSKIKLKHELTKAANIHTRYSHDSGTFAHGRSVGLMTAIHFKISTSLPFALQKVDLGPLQLLVTRREERT